VRTSPLPLLAVFVVVPLVVPRAAPSAHADASLTVPQSSCAHALDRARAAFVAEIDGAPDGFTIAIDAAGVRVRYYASLDMCGVYDDYRARAADGRVGFRVVDDDGHHAAAFESHFRPALRACLAAR
jgi:hypothetical protein